MQIIQALIGLLGIAIVTDGAALTTRSSPVLAVRQNNGNNNNRGNNGGNNGGNSGGPQLDLANIQDASNNNGQPDQNAGQSPSATDANNFINFCSGLENSNGEQKLEGSCNGIPMGQLPSKNNMVSSIILNPQDRGNIAANQDFTIEVRIDNIAAGTFTNPANTYYSAPQALDGSGNIIGHVHVTVQDTGADMNPLQPLDSTQFAFFKGINTPPNDQGLLTADVEGGLPEGNYHLCTLTAAANHQPVLMPVAQRGSQDDCVRFSVGGDGGGN